MTIDTLIMSIGAFVAILPFLGFPITWDRILLVIAGVIIITLGIMIRRRGNVHAPKRTHTFVENAPSSTNGHEEA